MNWTEIREKIINQNRIRFVGINRKGKILIVTTEHDVTCDGVEVIDITVVSESGTYKHEITEEKVTGPVLLYVTIHHNHMIRHISKKIAGLDLIKVIDN